MKKLILFAFAFILSLAVFYSCNEPLVEESTGDALELKSANSGAKSYIVVLNDSELNDELSNLKGYEMRQHAAKRAAEKVMNRAGITDGELGFVYGTAIKGFSVKIAPGQLKKLENDPSVKYVEEDQIISLGNPKTDGTLTAMAQTLPWGISRVNGGVNYDSNISGNHVAWIIDTGVDLTHPDLNVDAAKGASFVTRVTSPNDDNGHGTHVAGTIAAKDNTEGVIGVAAGATVIPVKVLDRRGSGTTTGVIAGIDYVAANGAAGDVANMSLGGGVSTSLDQAVYNASLTGVKFALAAGNESDNANNHSPARVNGDNIFTISAFGEGDVWAYFSNYGNPPVDYCEPGVSILSCYKGGGYATMSGTSMAAPHMAGILMWGLPGTDGTVSGDPDVTNSTPGYADPIGIVGGGTSTNNPPVANAGSDITVTDFNGDGELVTLNGTASTDDHGITSYIWTENGSTIASGVTPSVNFAVGTHTVTLTVSDGEFTDTDVVIVKVLEYTPTSIDLDASMEKIRGTRFVTLNWSGASGDSVVVKANGSVISTISNDRSETIDMGKSSGTFVFEVCETDGSTCSNPVTLVL